MQEQASGQHARREVVVQAEPRGQGSGAEQGQHENALANVAQPHDATVERIGRRNVRRVEPLPVAYGIQRQRRRG